MLTLSPLRGPSPRLRPIAAAVFGLLALFAAASTRAEERPNALGSPLDAVTTKLADRRWLVAFLLEPAAFFPGTQMPKSDLSEQEAADMAAFFYSLRPKPAAVTVPAGTAVNGERLFRQRGCAGCHSVVPGEKGFGPNLSGAGLMLKPAWTVAWLRDPYAYHPLSPMPKLELTDAEIGDLTAYLSTLRAGKERIETAGVEKHPGDARRGRNLVGDYECFKCHSITGFRPPEAPVRLPSEEELVATPDVALDKGRALVMFYRCRGCHSLEGEGGVIGTKLELKSQSPPTLDREGARVQPSWLKEFLKKPQNLRPWLDLRMPNYHLGDAEVRTLAAYLAVLSGATLQDEPVVAASPELIHEGQMRFDSYKCTQCHPASKAAAETIPPEDRAIDLTQAHTRLRPSWIEGFLSRPRDFAGPATRMPVVFIAADGTPKVSHPQEDIAALRAFLLAPQPLPAVAPKPKPERVDWSKVEY